MQAKQPSIAFFGGSFDPPHLAHIELIKQIPNFIDVSKIIIVPTRQSPLKEKASSWKNRIDLLSESLKSLELKADIEISDIELEIPPPNTTLRFLNRLEVLGVNTRDHWFCMGQDCWEQLPKWDRWDSVLKRVKIAIFKRNNSDSPSKSFPPDMDSEFTEKLTSIEPVGISFFHCELPDVSSSVLKEAILNSNEETMKKFLPEGVYKMIKDRDLYKNTPESVGASE